MKFSNRLLWRHALLAVLFVLPSLSPLQAQSDPQAPAGDLNGSELKYDVSRDFQSIELVIGSSRLITMPFNIPKVVVEDPAIVTATPFSKNQILVRALQTGITGVGIVDESEKSYTLEINVTNDVRQLQAVLNQTFPTANVTVRPLKNNVILVGTVPNPEMAAQIVDVSKKFAPEVFQNLQVSGAQNIALQMKVYEVSRSKLRRVGTDWAFGTRKTLGVQSVSDVITASTEATGTFAANSDTLRFGVLNGSNQFFGALEFLEQHDVAKLLDEPTLVTLNGRPAEFLEGGEVPILVNAGLGVASIEFRPFGTKVDFLPIVLGNGRLRLDLRYEVSQIAEGLSGDTDTPGFTVRRANVAVEMNAGHTLVVAGDIQERVQSTKRGIPGLMHMPWVGSAFRKNQEQVEESELVVVATPRFIGEVDPSLLPELGVGQNTHVPTNSEFYGRGYMEVPRCEPSIEQTSFDSFGPSYRGNQNPPGNEFQGGQPAPSFREIAPNDLNRNVPADPVAWPRASSNSSSNNEGGFMPFGAKRSGN